VTQFWTYFLVEDVDRPTVLLLHVDRPLKTVLGYEDLKTVLTDVQNISLLVKNPILKKYLQNNIKQSI